MPEVVTAATSPTYATTHTVPVNGDPYVALDVKSLAQKLLDNDKAIKTIADGTQDDFGQLKYELSFCLFGNPLPGVLAMFITNVAFSLPATSVGRARAVTAAASATVLTFAKNGTQIGTITFGGGSDVGTVAITGATSFAVGDYLTISGPATADSTLATVAVTLTGTQAYA